MSESITEFEFVDEIQRKFDQLYRALAKTNPWVPVPGDDDSMACIYCQRRRAHAQMYEAKSAHAADCLYMEAAEYMAKVYVDHLPKVIVINDSK